MGFLALRVVGDCSVAINIPYEREKSLKITRLKTAVVEGNFDWTFVKIETDEGLTGLGECFFAPGLTAILRSLEPLLIGEDPRDIQRVIRKLQMATSGAGSVAGILYNGISGIDAALWDVLGQALGAPIYRLLGGKFRDKVRIYADCHGGESLESLDECLRSRGASWDPQGHLHKVKDYYDHDQEAVASTPEDYKKQALKKKSGRIYCAQVRSGCAGDGELGSAQSWTDQSRHRSHGEVDWRGA